MYQMTDDELAYFVYMSQQEQAEEDTDLIAEARN